MLALEKEHLSLQATATPLGPPTLVTTLASGGVALNIVPPHASISIDRRVTSGERSAAVCIQLESLACAHVHACDPAIAVTTRVSGPRSMARGRCAHLMGKSL